MASLARAPAGPTHALCLTSQHLSPLQEEYHKGHPDSAAGGKKLGYGVKI